ncbi:multicopper oxidase family protein [Pseudonocardia sp.]|uniref:multicopper oxidase family protein n=1 Tax=Pseudonocardia sp. TaxID=60912 RepID=UPI003D10CC08
MIPPISRRRALQLGGLGLAATVVGGAGLAAAAGSRFSPTPGAELSEPAVLRSTGGLLQVRLEAAEQRVPLAGGEATILGYNGGLPGPTLRLHPGDRLRVDLANRLGEATNLHVHGLHVSPQGNGDNSFLAVQPGDTFAYEFRLPPDHPPGVYWYHPHHHGTVADQIFGGLYGAIIVDDPVSIPVTRERVLVVSDISVDDTGRIQQPSPMAQMMGREGELVLVNGQRRPRLHAGPRDRERWRIVNACTARYLRLRLDGQQMQLLGIDSGHFAEPRAVEEFVLTTGNRADLLVTTAAGTAELRALPVDRGGMTGMMGGMMGGRGPGGTAFPTEEPVTLADLEVAGPAAVPLPAVPARAAARDLRAEPVATRRRITFAMGMGAGMGMGMTFTIDGKRFDPDRIDQLVAAGTVEEWTVVNTSPMDHPLHLHVWPMQLIARTGRPVTEPTWQDVVNVPARSDVTLRVAFDHFTGRTVYHCHVLDHEDRGMMAVLEAR